MRTTRQITIETHSITLIKTSGAHGMVYCEHCREPVTTFSPEQLAYILQLDITEICRSIEAGQFHLTQTERSSALICSKSITDMKKRGKV